MSELVRTKIKILWGLWKISLKLERTNSNLAYLKSRMGSEVASRILNITNLIKSDGFCEANQNSMRRIFQECSKKAVELHVKRKGMTVQNLRKLKSKNTDQ